VGRRLAAPVCGSDNEGSTPWIGGIHPLEGPNTRLHKALPDAAGVFWVGSRIPAEKKVEFADSICAMVLPMGFLAMV
jgi:hypothetical protein